MMSRLSLLQCLANTGDLVRVDEYVFYETSLREWCKQRDLDIEQG